MAFELNITVGIVKPRRPPWRVKLLLVSMSSFFFFFFSFFFLLHRPRLNGQYVVLRLPSKRIPLGKKVG